MIDYVKTKIYKIYCKDLSINEIYIGHSTNLTQRIREHKYNCTNENSKSYNLKTYEIIRNSGGWDEWVVEEIENYPCNTRTEALSRENYWFHTLNPVMNMISPVLDNVKRIATIKTLTDKYKIEIKKNKDIRDENKKQFLLDNKEKIKIDKKNLRKKYVSDNREKINSNMRAYNKKTTEIRKILAKKYYEERKARGYYIKTS